MYSLEFGNFPTRDKDSEWEAQLNALDESEEILILAALIDRINYPILWCTYAGLEK